MISAGQQSRKLPTLVDQLASDLEDQQLLRSKLLSASLYPAIVSLVALAIVIFLLTTVVPQVAEVFVGSKRELPLLTVVMLAISDFVRQWGWLMLSTLICSAFAFQIAMRQPHLRVRFDAT